MPYSKSNQHTTRFLLHKSGNIDVTNELLHEILCHAPIGTLHGVPKVPPTFMHHNKLTVKVVSKLLLGLTTLSQALIHTPIPNLMGVT